MNRIRISLLSLCLMLSLLLSASADRVNRSAGWSSGEDESDLIPVSREDDDSSSVIINAHDELDGGFSSLDGMLQWAIGHSDPTKLKDAAQDAKRLSPSELSRRQQEIKELVEKLKMPSDSQLMQIALDDLNNSSLSLEDRNRALEELLILVEPIDNANDLTKLGGISVLIRELNHSDTNVRRISAWILGKASQNNPFFQKQVLELGAMSKLVKMVKSSFVEEAIKALYAVSALVRNDLTGQEIFYAEAGDLILQDILSNSSTDVRLRRKAASLVGDLVEWQLDNIETAEQPSFSNRFFLKTMVDLIASLDLDLQEKALVAVKNLLQLREADALVFRDFCGLDVALKNMKQRLLDLSSDEDQRDYATDMETLRREVELIFHGKLTPVNEVPPT